MFEDRKDAGGQLAKALIKYKGIPDGVVVAIPRGGVVPAKIVADQLQLPLEMVMVKKIGHPTNPEYAIGAVSLKTRIVDSPVNVSEDYLNNETDKIRKLMNRRYEMYYGPDKKPADFENKVVIVIDDGVATGSTLVAALDMIRKEGPQKLIVAVPVGPTSTIPLLENHSDEVVCLETYDNFYAISPYYKRFDQVSDEEVSRLIHEVDHI